MFNINANHPELYVVTNIIKFTLFLEFYIKHIPIHAKIKYFNNFQYLLTQIYGEKKIELNKQRSVVMWCAILHRVHSTRSLHFKSVSVIFTLATLLARATPPA